MDALEKIVGKGNVFDDEATLAEYSVNNSFVTDVRPRCVVKAGSTEDVVAIVKWANETATPLVPVSSGPPHFHADTVPRTGGAVILDMSGMKKIYWTDKRNRTCIVEPGVTFGELQKELQKNGLCAFTPLGVRASKSVLTSALEREPYTMPAYHWDSVDPFLCGEIVYGTGEVLRTGEAATPGTLEEKRKIGNTLSSNITTTQMDEDRLVSGAQGTMGIVTFMSLKCRDASEFATTFMIPSASLKPLVELSLQLLRIREGDHLFILNALNLAAMLAKTPEEIEALRATLPPWVLVVSAEAYGELPADRVDWLERDIAEMAFRTGGLDVVTPIPGASGDVLSKILDTPTDDYFKERYRGGFSDVFFLSVMTKAEEFVDTMTDMAMAKGFSPEDIGIYIQPIVQGSGAHIEFDLYYDPADAPTVDKVKWLSTEGTFELANKGAFFSRPYGYWSTVAYGRAPLTADLQRKLKDIYDPNGVLNPGQLCF
jgi:FAD/FMN-containing dehydrogenase